MKKPSFFKVMFLDFHERLRIPRAFRKHLAKELPDTVTLEGPSGDVWHVKLSRTEDDIYLVDGWEVFKSDHSLEVGEFLVFDYDGNMHFQVQVFSRNGCEREAAFNVKCSQELMKPPRIKRRSSPLKHFERKKHSRPHKTSPESPHPSPDSKDFRKNCITEKYLPLQCQQSGSPTAQVLGSILPPPKQGTLGIYQKHEAENAVRSFTSSLPTFVVEIKPYSVSLPFHLSIPAHFSKTHLPPISNILLQNLEGKRWNVKIHRKRSQTLFCGGWRSFSMGNKLGIGDYCAFELVDQFEMKVHIFHVRTSVAENSS